MGKPYPSGFSQRAFPSGFNPTAFAQPEEGAFGNSPRNVIRAPGIANIDFSLFKNFKAGEHFDIQFRYESFNFLNHPQFAQPDASVDDYNADSTLNHFGVISSQANAGRENQFALKNTLLRFGGCGSFRLAAAPRIRFSNASRLPVGYLRRLEVYDGDSIMPRISSRLVQLVLVLPLVAISAIECRCQDISPSSVDRDEARAAMLRRNYTTAESLYRKRLSERNPASPELPGPISGSHSRCRGRSTEAMQAFEQSLKRRYLPLQTYALLAAQHCYLARLGRSQAYAA